MQINAARMVEIKELVDAYDDQNENVLTDALAVYEATITTISGPHANELAKEDLVKIKDAANQMHVEFTELIVWFRQWVQEAHENHLAKPGGSEEKLRDVESRIKKGEF